MGAALRRTARLAARVVDELLVYTALVMLAAHLILRGRIAHASFSLELCRLLPLCAAGAAVLALAVESARQLYLALHEDGPRSPRPWGR